MCDEMRADEMARRIRPVYERAEKNFAKRNPNSVATRLAADSVDGPPAASSVDVPREGLKASERSKAAMLEALAWSENLVLYQRQRMAALKLILKAWAGNPASLEPPRVFLRCFLPAPVTRGVVRAKRAIRGVGA
jgi:hypothetical protein